MRIGAASIVGTAIFVIPGLLIAAIGTGPSIFIGGFIALFIGLQFCNRLDARGIREKR